MSIMSLRDNMQCIAVLFCLLKYYLVGEQHSNDIPNRGNNISETKKHKQEIKQTDRSSYQRSASIPATNYIIIPVSRQNQDF